MSERPAGAARDALPREPRLDALRGLAIVAVLVLHYTLAFGLARSPLGVWLGRPLLAVLTLLRRRHPPPAMTAGRWAGVSG